MDNYIDMILIAKAMESLGSGTILNISGNKYSGIYWDSEPTFSEEEFDAKVAELQEEYDNDYARKRQAEYPSIREVTVALAEKAEGDSTMWEEITAKRAKVKADYPKP